MEKAYKFRLYPTDEQKTLFLKTFGCTRFVYNKYWRHGRRHIPKIRPL